MADPSAESYFRDFVSRVARGETVDIERLCVEHPSLAEELRHRHADWVFQQFEADDDAEKPEGGGVVGDWTPLLERLRARDAAWRRYTVRGEIGRGGMGVVLRVFDRDMLRPLAMKVVRYCDGETVAPSASPLSDPLLARFLEEAQVTGQLDHPGVVPVHDVGIDAEGRIFFTMKLVVGEDLRAIFQKVGDRADGWTLTRALNVLLRVTEAMSYAHHKGVIHRDLKPANVMVGRYGEAYVMDWGLARIVGREEDPSKSGVVRSLRHEAATAADSPLLTIEGAVVGTPAYMAPEQAAGRLDAISPQTDVYAAGAMLYELLAGRMPYLTRGEPLSPVETVSCVLAGPPESISSIAQDAPDELVAICEKAMARELDDRYPSMQDLGDDLRAYLEDRVVKAHATGPLVELRKWVRRNRTAAAAIVAVTTIVLGATLFVAHRERGAKVAIRTERDEVLRLGDARRVEDLIARAGALWPPYSGVVPAIEAWLGDARALVDRLPQHRELLDSIRAQALPYDDDAQRRDWESSPEAARCTELVGFVAAARHSVVQWDTDVSLGRETPASSEDTRESRVANVETQERRLADARSAPRIRRLWEFDDPTLGWRHEVLAALVTSLEAIAAPLGAKSRPFAGDHSIAAVEARLAVAREEAASGVTRVDEWSETIRAIADASATPAYRGLRIAPQHGLVPLGPDPASGLHEFWLPWTGERPARSADGRLVVDETCAMVLVLLPGRTFWLGAQPLDASAPNHDPEAYDDESPVTEVTLAPFFLSKYEMTQGQWLELSGEEPSTFNPRQFVGRAALARPVDGVSWLDCRNLLGRIGLALPTEAQWEYACRGGTSTPWSCGDSKESLAAFANVRDLDYGAEHEGQSTIEPWHDGFAMPAPVGSFLPNPFGLHDAHGNVWEWCADWGGFYNDPPREGDGARMGKARPQRIQRGGSHETRAEFARSSNRDRGDPVNRDSGVGVRPARALER